MDAEARKKLLEELPFDPRRIRNSGLTLPDLSDAVQGWRAWTVERTLPKFGLAPKLFSATYDDYWAPHVAHRALCEYHGDKEGHHIPDERCTCGFYAAKSLKHLLSMGYATFNYSGQPNRELVIGKVAMWGKVLEGNQGWRTEYAYPVILYIPYTLPELQRPLADGYGVPVTMLNWHGMEGKA